MGTMPPSSLAARKLELSRQKNTIGVFAGRLLKISFRSGMSRSMFSLETFQPPLTS
jgi:hypothetical protein